MKKILFVILLMAAQSFASNDDNNFSDWDEDFKVIPVENLKYQYEIQNEILVFEKASGRLLSKGGEERRQRFGSDSSIASNWSAKIKGFPDIALRSEWTLSPQGLLSAKIQQFDSMERADGDNVKLGKLIKEQEFKMDKLESMSWTAAEDSTRRVVVRYHVNIWADEDAVDIGPLGINSNRLMIFDGRGNLWASRVEAAEGNNVYFGIRTHKGSIYISYVPFKGAKKIGHASKGRIRLEDGNIKVNIESSEPFLPRGITANVYGIIDQTKRSPGYNQVRTMTSNKEDNFLRRIQNP